MLHLNLVSQELKQEIKLRHIYKMLKQANYILIIITIFIAIIILVAKIILQNNFNKVVEQTTLITRESQGQNIKIRDINDRLNYIGKIQDNFITWSFLFKELADNVNNDISFYSIKINKERKEIDLRGIAKSRNSLLVLKKSFDNSDIFLDIDFPMKNILEKEDINFEIKASLDLDKIGY